MRQSWTYGFCENCLRNAHEENRMVKRTVASTDSTNTYSEDLWVCTKCGSTRRL